jgi:RNA polymerase sigma factor (sigma-70 family)
VFQSTFLLLAREAANIRKPESLGHWLHGVAHRLAVRWVVRASRRRAAEVGRQEVVMAARGPDGDEVERRDVTRVVHEEIDRLPRDLRGPVLLCYLEGLTNEEAARHLGCPVGTVKVRLMRARGLLNGRLRRRGVGLSAALLLLLLPRPSAAGTVPPELVRSTVEAALAARRRAGGTGPLPGSGGVASRMLVMAVLAVSASGSTAASLYLSAPERVGFLTWLLGAVRRACH